MICQRFASCNTQIPPSASGPQKKLRLPELIYMPVKSRISLGLETQIHPVRTKNSEVSPTPSHSSTPRRSGRHPTSFKRSPRNSAANEKKCSGEPEPSHNEQPFLRAVRNAGKDTYSKTAARTKNAMNQGKTECATCYLPLVFPSNASAIKRAPSQRRERNDPQGPR